MRRCRFEQRLKSIFFCMPILPIVFLPINRIRIFVALDNYCRIRDKLAGPMQISALHSVRKFALSEQIVNLGYGLCH